MIREAVLTDVDQLVEMGRRFLASSAYRTHIAENPTQMAATVTWLIEQADGVVYVSEDKGGALTGMIGLLLYAHHLSGESTATEVFLWNEDGVNGVRLVKTAERWATDRGATSIAMIAPDDRVAAFYARIGYDKLETAHVKRLAA